MPKQQRPKEEAGADPEAGASVCYTEVGDESEADAADGEQRPGF